MIRCCCLLMLLSPSLWGAGDQWLLGNGRLTVRVDQDGALRSCYWPSPGHTQQLDLDQGASPGTRWGLKTGAQPVQWCGASTPAASALQDQVLRQSLRAGDLSLEATTFVLPTHDLLVSQVEVQSDAQVATLVWEQQFVPATSPAVGVLAALGLPQPRGFASYSPSPDILVQFRPEQPGLAAWGRAEELASVGGQDKAWERMGEGVWIVSTAVAERAQPWFRGETAAASASAALGRARCGYELRPAENSATVLIGFGATFDEAKQQVAYGLSKPIAELADETGRHWREWSNASPPPADANAGAWEAALLALALATERGSGATVNAAAKTGTLVYVDPVALGQAALAFSLAGKAPAAGAAISWYLQQASEDSASLYGSIPPYLRTDQRPLLPVPLHDIQGPAWVLAVALKHAAALEEEARAEFARAIAQPLQRVGDFLASWVHSGAGDLLPAYDREAMRDTVTQEARLVVWMGLACALRLAEYAGETAPEEWGAQLRELETQLRFQVLHQTEPWKIDPLLPLLLGQVLPDQRAIWEPITKTDPGTTILTSQQPDDATFSTSISAAALHCIATVARTYGHL